MSRYRITLSVQRRYNATVVVNGVTWRLQSKPAMEPRVIDLRVIPQDVNQDLALLYQTVKL